MRPLRLVIEGVRSYTRRQEVDFSDARLLAIVGDTGAGKSSLLEALCVALYGATTWDKGSFKSLISSGSRTLVVELDFEADDRRWTVTRSTSHGNYPPAVHLLVCDADGTRIDGATPVNRKLEELVGLSYDMFLRAVVLPQGRFQLLLQATRSDRTAILKGIFRLHHLDAVRAEAQALLDRLRPKLESLRTARAGLLDDPAAAAAAAGEQEERARELRDRLEEADAAHRKAREEAEEAGRRLAALEQARDEAGRADRLPDLRDRLAALHEAADASRSAIRGLEDRIAAASAELERLDARIGAREAAGVGLVDLRSARELLERRLGDLEHHRGAAADLERRVAEHRLDAGRTEELSASLRELTDAAEAARTTRNEAVRRAHQAAEALRRLEEAVRVVSGLEEERVDVEAEVAAADAALADLGERAEARRREVDSARAALRAIEIEADAARRADAAAHAAAGCAPGDPCPICERDLPAGWSAPEAAKLAAVETERDERTAALDAARSSLESVERDLALGRERAARHRERREELERRLEAVRAPFGPGDSDALPAARERAVAEDAAAAAALANADATIESTDAARHAAETDLQVHRTRLQAAETRLEEDRRSLDHLESGIREDLARLPDALGPPPAPEPAALRDLLEEVESRRRELEAATAERTGVAGGLDAARRELDAARARHESTVETPLRRAWRELGDVRGSLLGLIRALGADPPADLSDPSADGLPELVARADHLVQASAALRRSGEEAVERTTAARDAAEAAVRAALERAGVASSGGLREALIDATSTLRAARKDRNEAERQRPLAADLDRRIGRAEPFLAAIDEVRRLLADGKFVAWVVERKQRALLGVAGQILGGMTRERYGFSEEFEVVDRIAGETRDVKTLSGGETFLASLALALGLVELAGRSGGRLEALFLDEGFGTLDANVLSEALEALHRQAEKGRMVAVISHLRSVAENIERVLYVEKTPEGSRLRWLGPEEREALVEDEAALGLVS